MVREELLARTFVELTDTLVDNFDVVDLLTRLTDRCVEVLGASAAGILLASSEGDLGVVASSSEAVGVLELFELQCEGGPCLDAFRGDCAVSIEDVDADDSWERLRSASIAAGFSSVHALPMHLRGRAIGVLSLFTAQRGMLGRTDLTAAQAFADVATIAVLQHRAATESRLLIDELNHALNSRIVIEQAKGFLAERAAIGVEESFHLIRQHARNSGQLLVNVARRIIDGTIEMNEIIR